MHREIQMTDAEMMRRRFRSGQLIAQKHPSPSFPAAQDNFRKTYNEKMNSGEN
jgi:hypothetical protein